MLSGFYRVVITGTIPRAGFAEAGQGELGNDFHTRIEGTRVSLKLYDKLGIALRIETTGNDAAFFKQRRSEEHRDGNLLKRMLA